MNLDMNQLRAFVTVAELKSFSKTAQKLCRVQSAISQQIQKLERQLQADLFIRDTRPLELTARGDQLLAYATRILAINDQALTTLADRSCTGILKIGSSDTYASHYFTDLIKRCALRFPDLHLDVQCGYSRLLWERYEAGDLDVVLTQGCPERIPSELLHSEPLSWVCAGDSQAFEQDPLPLAPFTKGCGDRERIINALHRAGRTYRVGYHSTSHAGLLAAVASGCYVSALLPSTAQLGFRQLGEVEGLPSLGHVEISLAYHDTSPDSLATRFAEQARDYFQARSRERVSDGNV